MGWMYRASASMRVMVARVIGAAGTFGFWVCQPRNFRDLVRKSLKNSGGSNSSENHFFIDSNAERSAASAKP